MVTRDGSSTLIGTDVLAIFALTTAKGNYAAAQSQLAADINNPNITSSATTLSGFSAVEREYAEILEGSYQQGDFALISATLISLAESSNPILAGMASAELIVSANKKDTDYGITAIYDYVLNGSVPSSVLVSFSQEVAKAGASLTLPASATDGAPF